MKTTERPPVKNYLERPIKANNNCPICNESCESVFCSNLCKWSSEYCTRIDDNLHSKDFNNQRWVVICLNSSIEAMKEIQRL